ncbi:WbqC family protein [Neolewinella antarctica]|uniref:Uncharacterized protein n=1 Tax=Neolewinella antarctica TaxID=442734 RepID=A0ABX0XBJ6_9BACT|nr:WbqC family protein [Neolewinella antarctica]NJC26147.1 hypothetical protein [Neolewinella antarctica]
MTAVMQPYLFPYPGYYQLVAAVDEFVFYDDVQYIKGGYINRNKLAHGSFTVPLTRGSSSDTIEQKLVDEKQYDRFRAKWYKSFRLNYGSAPFYDAALEVATSVFDGPTKKISDLAADSVSRVAEYLTLPVAFSKSSDREYDRSLQGQERLLALLAVLNTDSYVNAIGGRELYDGKYFKEMGIQLSFLAPAPQDEPLASAFPYSILHLIAHHSPDKCRDYLRQNYKLLTDN